MKDYWDAFVFLIKIGIIIGIGQLIIMGIFGEELGENIIGILGVFSGILFICSVFLISPILNIYAGIKYKAMRSRWGFWVCTSINIFMYSYLFCAIKNVSSKDGSILLVEFLLLGIFFVQIFMGNGFYQAIKEQRKIEKGLQEINDEINLQNPQK